MPDYKLTANGIGKIFAGEILELIATLLLVGAGVAAFAAIDSDDALALAGGAGIAGFIALILELIGFIITLVGLSRSGKQEPYFKRALVLIIVTIILSVVAGIVSAMSTQESLTNILNSIASLFPVIAILFIVKGCGSVLRTAGDTALAKLSSTLGAIVLVLFFAAVIFQFFRGIFDSMTTASAVLLIAYAVTTIVAYIMFLILLAKTKKSLLRV